MAKIVQSYITCEGRKDVVRPRNLKLLAVLKQKCSVNLPAFLNSLLHDVARSMKKAQHKESVVSHHGLIRLIVSHSLTQQHSSWEELIDIINERAATSGHPEKRKQTDSTPQRPEKRKKDACTEVKVEKQAEKQLEEQPDAGTSEQPANRRKLARLAGIRVELKKPRAHMSQAIEIIDEQSAETYTEDESNEDVEQSTGTEAEEEISRETEQSAEEET